MATVPPQTEPRNPVAFYANLAGMPGVVLRTRLGAVWFLEEGTKARTLLHPCDAADLDLHGNVALTLRQQRQDGPGYAWVMARNVEHARVAA